jgi:hypothetical protein
LAAFSIVGGHRRSEDPAIKLRDGHSTAGVRQMAVAYDELRSLIGRTDNDNRPGFFAVRPKPPARLPAVRPEALELEYANLATRLEPETGILWAHFLHRQRACFTAELLADLRHFQDWLRDSFGACTREEMRSGTWSGRRARRARGTWAATSRASPA